MRERIRGTRISERLLFCVRATLFASDLQLSVAKGRLTRPAFKLDEKRLA
jgi:hypothetical protein